VAIGGARRDTDATRYLPERDPLGPAGGGKLGRCSDERTPQVAMVVWTHGCCQRGHVAYVDIVHINL
jgi:hypothetical protein